MATSIERTWADEIVETAQRDGEVRKARHDVLRVLRARFGDVPIALEERVAALADEEELGRLLERAAVILAAISGALTAYLYVAMWGVKLLRL